MTEASGQSTVQVPIADPSHFLNMTPFHEHARNFTVGVELHANPPGLAAGDLSFPENDFLPDQSGQFFPEIGRGNIL